MITFKETKSLKEYDAVSLAAQLREHFTRNYPASIVEKLNDAIQVASYLHRNDVRRGARGKSIKPPYIEHPLRVALRLVRFGVTDAAVIFAAILHDTVEDHPFDFSDFQGVMETTDERAARERALGFIATHFGYRTAAIVEDVSNPIQPEGQSKTDKISAYLAHVITAVNYSWNALLVKSSDFIDNAGSLHHHYEYGDEKVLYFIDRYEPLIPIYLAALDNQSENISVDVRAMQDRLRLVGEEFAKFRAGTAKAKEEHIALDKVVRSL